VWGGGVDVDMRKTITLIFLDLELVHHFIDRKLVMKSQCIFQANPTKANFILVTGRVLSTTTTFTAGSGSYYLCERRSVGQSVLVSGPHLGPMTRFLLLSDICSLHVEGRPA
jgi:hypothetical protein